MPAIATLRPPSLVAVGNFLGLVFAFAGASLIAALIVYESAFDRGIDPDRQVYRLNGLLSVPGQTPRPVPGLDPEMASAIVSAHPDWKVARLAFSERVSVEIDGRSIEEIPNFADAELAKVFRIPRSRGDPGAALARPDGVVLSKEAAEKLCGRRNCLGSAIRVGEIAGRVGAIVDWPANSSLSKYHVLISAGNPASPLALADAPVVHSQNASNGVQTRFVIKSAATFYVKAAGPAAQIITELNKVALPNVGVNSAPSPFTTVPDAYTLDASTRAAAAAGDPDLERLDPQALLALSIAGLLTLLVATLSYVSLAAAQAIARGREIGIRKAFGATSGALVLQVVVRAIVEVFLAAVIGMFVGYLALGWFSALTGRALYFPREPGFFLLALVIVAGIGGLAAIAPAALLALPKPAVLLNGREGNTPGSGPLRAVLVAMQLAVAAIAGAFALTLAEQLRHDVSFERLRFDPQNVALARLRGQQGFPIVQPQRADELVQAALAQPGVLSAATSSSAPSFFQPQSVSMRRIGEAQETELSNITVSPGFFQTLRIALLAGRLFQEGDVRPIFSLSGDRPVVLSRSAAIRLGFERAEVAIGATVQLTGQFTQAATVIGVVDDAPMGEVRLREPGASVFFCGRDLQQFLFVRAAPGGAPEQVMAKVLREESLFTRNSVERLAARIRFQYRELFRITAIVSVLTIMNMIAAAIGLTALALGILQRMRLEAGVRKTFGAMAGDLIALFARRLALPIGLGLASGLAVSFWAARAYLSQFPEPAQFSWVPSALVALCVLLAFALVVALFGLRLARLRPSEALRVT